MSECPNCGSIYTFYNPLTDRKAIYSGCHNCGTCWLNKDATIKHTDLTEQQLENTKEIIPPEEVEA